MSQIKNNIQERIAANRAIKWLRSSAQRGMVTAEYAVGILAAVALALVLLKVFKADSFLNTITELISLIVKTFMGWIA
jgi:hypothetical protein